MIKKSQWIAVTILALSVGIQAAHAQYSSGSNGSDGALNLTTPGTIIFDPVALGIDTDGDNVFHFTTITIGAGVIVQMKNAPLRAKPVVWLATGVVDISGTIDLSGEPGHPANAGSGLGRIPAQPGPGGYSGGLGATSPNAATDGNGPGGGVRSSVGGGASHAVGTFAVNPYGNSVLVPLRGGSGGAGGSGSFGGGGGAGAGAIRIASSVSISIGGSITAKGGNGGSGGTDSATGFFGGNGSGGAIHLIAPSISGAGAINAAAGATISTAQPTIVVGSVGRVRLDAFTQGFTGTSTPAPTFGLPYDVPLPTNPPSIRVVTIAGIPVSTNPTGSFTVPDVAMNQPGPVSVAIEARNVPLAAGSAVRLYIISGSDPDITIVVPGLAGTLALSTATGSATFPPGYSRGYVRATW